MSYGARGLRGPKGVSRNLLKIFDRSRDAKRLRLTSYGQLFGDMGGMRSHHAARADSVLKKVWLRWYGQRNLLFGEC